MSDDPRGLTPREVGRRYRMSAERVRAMIVRGELGAVDTARTRCGRPRWVVMPHHLADWERSRRAGPLPRPAPRRRRTGLVDYYQDP
jgi:hypothetical protein